MRLAFLLSLVLALGCVKRLERSLTPPIAMQTVDRKAPFLKVHMRDGSLYVLSPWTANDSLRQVSGTGIRYGVDRLATDSGSFSVSLDSVSLLETNVARTSPSVAVLSVVTGITAAVAIACASDPKACFGSCPTFYVGDGTRDILQAEGFSASVAPRLEARDVDALPRARPVGRELRVKMLNEAYETHVVRYVNILAVPRVAHQRVFADLQGDFWSVTEPVPPTTCTAPEGDCTLALAAFDERERFSKADSVDLAARELVELTFDAIPGAPALVLASRQSLLPTYLLYQAFAYLGSSVGRWLAALDRADAETARRAGALVGALGGIDVLVPDANGGWDSVATIRETGPLASDVRLVPLPRPTGGDRIRVRLRMARGAWRVDFAALTSIGGTASPIRIEPSAVLDASGREVPGVRAKLASAAPLVTFPGDQYTFVYSLPDDAPTYELFLETKGYYLEWMRSEWLAEENPLRAASLFLDPAGSLRRLAPQFKRAEPKLEAAFWRSRYVAR